MTSQNSNQYLIFCMAAVLNKTSPIWFPRKEISLMIIILCRTTNGAWPCAQKKLA
uniref:Uncharacterized protein n=1 Tax=Arundo donax TaxID=35708 RepID=A0A0A9DDM9_ARUDO